MTLSIVSMCVSAALIAFLTALFRYERQRGMRFMESTRSAFDETAVRLEDGLRRTVRYLGKEMPRQSLHYFFHTMLLAILGLLEKSKSRVEAALRMNRVLARRIRQPRTERNKLDEIAEHKESVALSEKEKKLHKKKTLEGN